MRATPLIPVGPVAVELDAALGPATEREKEVKFTLFTYPHSQQDWTERRGPCTHTCEGSAATPLEYDAQYTNDDTGLVYLRARSYDPATGQFQTIDPLVGSTVSQYGYVRDNPVNAQDLKGLATEELPCYWPFCGPPPPVVEPVEKAAHAVGHLLETVLSTASQNEGSAGQEAETEQEAQERNAAERACPHPSAEPSFLDPTIPPGLDWQWRPEGGDPAMEQGAWFNPKTGESLHPDLEHDEPIGPHYDYKVRGERGPGYRVYPDGRVEPK